MAVPHPHPETADIQLVDVLAALGHPVRLEVMRALVGGEERFCGEVATGVPRSSMTHHWRILRESGVLRQRPDGRRLYLSLRRADIDARFPGLLDAVFAGSGSPSAP